MLISRMRLKSHRTANVKQSHAVKELSNAPALILQSKKVLSIHAFQCIGIVSGIAQLLGQHCAKLAYDLVLLLLCLLKSNHSQCTLLLGTVYLILLPETHCVHELVSRATHDVALGLQAFDLFRFPADLASSRDTHVLLNISSDGLAFTRQ
jgi:hypothetical protein